MTRLPLLVAVLLAWTLPLRAQPAFTETYVQPGEFEIDYPAGWQVQVDEQTGFVALTSQENLNVTLYSPAVLAAYDLDTYNPETLIRLILNLNGVEPGDLQVMDAGTTVVDYRNMATGNTGLLIARVFEDNTVALMDVFAPVEQLLDQREWIVQLAFTYDVPPVPAPLVLAEYAEPWPQAVIELEKSGLIPVGGELVFAEDYVFASGSSLTIPLAQNLSLTDVVMAGTLRYTPSASPVMETCGMLARVSVDDSGLEVGITSAGELFLSLSGSVQMLQNGLDVTGPQRVILVALGERLLVYLNGDLIADWDVPPGSGYSGVRVQGDAPGATCEVSDVWVYRAPTVAAGICEITASGGAVNQRGGPGTGFEIVAVLDDGAVTRALAQSSGTDGLVWWQLESGGWVREDVVSEAGACRALPASG